MLKNVWSQWKYHLENGALEKKLCVCVYNNKLNKMNK